MKKGLKITLIVAGCVLAVAGGIAAYVRFAPKKTVDVTPASNWMMSYMPNQSYLYGIVTSDASQIVTKSEDRTVLEMFVSTGDTVAVGDPLVRFDTTKDELTLEEKQLERVKLYNTLAAAYKEYARYARKPYPSPLPSDTPLPEDTASATAAPVLSRAGGGSSVVRLAAGRVRRDLSAPTGGDGSSGDPYVYSISDGEQVTEGFLTSLRQLAATEARTVCATLSGSRTTINLTCNADGTVAFTVVAPDQNPKTVNLSTPTLGNGSDNDPFVYSYASNAAVGAGFIADKLTLAASQYQPMFVKLDASGFAVFIRFNADNTFSFKVTLVAATPKPTLTPEPTLTPDPNATPEPSDQPINIPSGGGMSTAERQAYAQEIAKKIREDETKYRQLGLDIQKLQLSGANGILYCTVAGTVSTVNEPDSVSNGDTIIEVRGGTGIHIVSILSEMDLDKYPVGTELEGFSYESGITVTVRVASVGTMPVTTSYSNGGNTNASGYLAVMEIVGEEQPALSEYIEFSSFQPLSETGEIYLHEAYIREIDGLNYIFVMRGDIIRREQVTTGKRIDSYIELIGSSLTMDDYLAFPYDKNCKDGASAKIADDDIYYG